MAKPKAKYGYYADPRLSANQLAELVNASPTRRKSIIAAAKFPKTAIVAKYRDATDALIAYLCDPARGGPQFIHIIQGLELKSEDPSLSQWVRDDAAASAEALQRIQVSYNQTGLGSLDIRPLARNKPKVDIEGVEVSSSAACSVHGQYKGDAAVGCLSLMFNKSEPSAKMRDERCRSAAVISLLFAEQHLAHFGQPLPRLNLSLDIFRGRLVAAPNTYKRRLDDMNYACEETALRWPTIDPPPDYDGPPIP